MSLEPEWSSLSWSEASFASRLEPPGPTEAHVWGLDLLSSRASLGPLEASLDSQERARAERFLSPDKGRLFRSARAVLRGVLGSYTGIEPADVPIVIPEDGKPRLDAATPEGPIEFNISHSGSLFLCAVARAPVGVDVEVVRGDVAHDELAERFLADAEREALTLLAAGLRLRSFLACWTRKEAIAKALGLGMRMRWSSFSVSVLPEEAPRILSSRFAALDPSAICLHTLPLGDGAAGTLATMAGVDRVILRHWRPAS